MSATSFFYLPRVSVLGAGSLNEIGEQASRLARRFLLVTDSYLASTEVTSRIRCLLDERQIDLVIYDKVQPNPTLESVYEAHSLYAGTECGGIISLGGGSAHDCAKAVAVLAANPAPIEQYAGVDRFPNQGAPVITVNTTAGTGSEITNCFLLTDTKTNTKLIFEGVHALANVAIDDPELMLTLPRELTAATGMDALTHAIECYVSKASFKLTDELARIAVQYIFRSLPAAVADPDNLDARDDMVYGQYMAGMAFGNGGVGLVHATAHALGGLYNLPHGLLNAILLPHVMRFNKRGCAGRYAELHTAIAPLKEKVQSARGSADAFISEVEQLSRKISTDIPLHKLGVREEDFEAVAEKALKDACCDTNPVCPVRSDIIGILTSAF
ncbi:iron-containing alcohol dehydrogenase [Extibacter sp. GGCC_0201]|uniref:iron-containing alcohol dehydrogenase n=1 Tax=Extibacter sp. GGCC_0201 TaxID=2731209 RepID=UPI001AA138F7|nr:iron-containing alcohol dehydrogenase [Extibacter sp. GGCC_0201]MBO1719717.1 iron-containing alcohol dehydrogenase [Extibacter sp. GGCC_0201]